MIHISERISLSESDLEWHFVRASGPGGQNVNKVSTAVELRFDVARAHGIAEDVKARLRKLAGRRMNAGGVLTIQARRFRSQALNREDALRKLIDLLADAAHVPATRRKTAVSLGQKRRRLEEKRKRGNIKGQRARVREFN